MKTFEDVINENVQELEEGIKFMVKSSLEELVEAKKAKIMKEKEDEEEATDEDEGDEDEPEKDDDDDDDGDDDEEE